MARKQLMQDLVRESYTISDDIEKLVSDLMLVLKKKDLENKILQEKLLFYETTEYRRGENDTEEKRLFNRLKQNLYLLDQKLNEPTSRPKANLSSRRSASLSPMPSDFNPASKPPRRSSSVPNSRLKSCLKPSPGWK